MLIVAPNLRIDPDEMLQYVAPWAYVVTALLYSGMVFRDEFAPKGVSAFSKGQPAIKILAVHACYVVILLSLIRIVSFAIFHLPRWMTNTFEMGSRAHVPASIADLCVLLVIAGLSFSERTRLYDNGTD